MEKTIRKITKLRLRKPRSKPKPVISFFRAQLTSMFSSALDFILVIGLTEFAGLWYVASNFIGASGGAACSFLLGRYWAFVSTKKKIYWQAMRYGIVAVGSVFLNTLGVFLITESTGMNYIFSKAIVSLVIGLGFNYVLHRWFVFR